MQIVTSADDARVDYTKWTREDLERLRMQLEAEPESAAEVRAVVEEIQRRRATPPVQRAIPSEPPVSALSVRAPLAETTRTPEHSSFGRQAAMQRGIQGIQWWVLGSAALMVIGAFGPWLKALGQSVGGTDGSNDGWLVVAAAAISALLFYATRTRRAAGVWGLLGGIAGLAITLYDRSNVQNAIDNGGALAQAIVQVGWGLNLALAASASLSVASAVYLSKQREQEQPLPPPGATPPRLPAAPTSPPTPPMSSSSSGPTG